MSHLAPSPLRPRRRAGSVRLLAALAISVVAAGIVCAEPGVLESPFLAQPLDEVTQPFEARLDSSLLESALLEGSLRDGTFVTGESDVSAVGSVPGGSMPLSITSTAPARSWIGDDWMWNLEDSGAVLPLPATARPQARSVQEAGATSLLKATWRIVGKPRVLVAAAAAAAAILLLVTFSRAV